MRDKTKYLAMGAIAVIVVLAVGAAVGSHSAFAQGPGGRGRQGGPGGPMGPGPGGRMGPGGPMGGGAMGVPGAQMLGRLGLTDGQRDQVKQILGSHSEEQKALGDKARAAHEAVALATTADAFDEGALRARLAELAAIEADMAVLNARIYSEVFRILTSEQQDRLKKMQATQRERQENRRPNPPRGRQGI